MQTTRHSLNPIDGGRNSAAEDMSFANDDVLSDIMRRHNQRLFRIARSILKDDWDAEARLDCSHLSASVLLPISHWVSEN